MLKKDVLIFLYEDWKGNLKRLNDELRAPAADSIITQERIAQADKWMSHYAEQLLALYGVKV